MPTGENILVVDDDERIRRLLTRYLGREGYLVREAGSVEEMRHCLAEALPSLVILDLMLPDGNGLTLAREIRARSDVPIIMLTGKSDTVDKVVGLEIGADDYVTKPFDQRELLARVRTVLRRAGTPSGLHAGGRHITSARFAGWCLDLLAHELRAPSGESVYLTSTQFELLAALVKHPNRVLSREEILDLVAGRDWSPMDRSIDVLVGKLRKKIEVDPKTPSLIKTVRGAGYKFTGKVELG
jgi:two-component system, OmpR family, torCAD operon response regulator TorR